MQKPAIKIRRHRLNLVIRTPQDITARLLAAELGKQMGQLIVADNRPGAGGSIGTEIIVRAPADGYTIVHSGITVLAIDRSVRSTLPYYNDTLITIYSALLISHRRFAE